MEEGNIILRPKSSYGIDKIYKHGYMYSFVKIVEGGQRGDFLVLIRSNEDGTKFVVKLESDKDFKVMLN